MAPVLQSAEHDLDAVAAFVSPFVVSDLLATRLSTRDAGTYTFVFQSFSEPVRVIAAIPKQPLDLWQAVEERSSTLVIAYLSSSDEEAERASLAIADGMKFGPSR